MSLYAEYIAELTQGHVYETEHGFATYAFPDKNTCYIKEIYVQPKFRNKDQASNLSAHIESIARERGCTRLLGSVVPSANGSTTSVKVLLAYGFRLDSSTNDYILFRKDL